MINSLLSFTLNLPYTIAGLITGLISVPRSILIRKKPLSIVVEVKSFWWAKYTYLRRARAMTVGHTILLGPKILDRDLEHELIHVRQYEQEPLVYPLLYYTELIRKGYRNSKYEDEAYRKSGSIYKGIK